MLQVFNQLRNIMRKIIFCSALTILLFSIAKISYAKDGFYLGLDINNAKVEHRYKVSNPGATGASDDNSSVGFGLSAGYRFDVFEKFFLAPEIFYDNIHSDGKTHDCHVNTQVYCSDDMKVNFRYGAKLNAGYRILPKTEIFANFGISNVDWVQNFYGYHHIVQGIDSMGHTATETWLYGIGAAYDLSDHIAIRTSYDISSFRTPYLSNASGIKDKVSMSIFKVGVVYKF